jgi:hypothetical protein
MGAHITVWARSMGNPRNTPEKSADLSYPILPMGARFVPPPGNIVDVSQPLSWNPVAGAQAYRVYVGTEPGANDLLDSGDIVQPSFDASRLGEHVGVAAVAWDVEAVADLDIWGYAMRLDGERTDFGLLEPTVCSSGSNVPECYRVQLPPLAAGSHSLQMSAYNSVGETLAPAIDVNPDRRVYVRLWTKIGGQWGYTDTSFEPTPLSAQLVYPSPGAVRVDITRPLRWSAVPGAQSYSLTIGRAPGTSEFLNVPDTQSTSWLAETLPGDTPLFVRIGTRVGGVWRYTDSVFIASAAVAFLSEPQNGATGVATTGIFWWIGINGADAYRIDVGRSPGATDVLQSAERQDTYYLYANLPSSTKLYVRLWTRLNGIWRHADSEFTTRFVPAPGVTPLSQFVAPLNGATVSGTAVLFKWTTIAEALGYHLHVGSSPGADDYGMSPDYLTATQFSISNLPAGRTMFARLYTQFNVGDWDHYVDITITRP